ncbi:MAG TPA: GNAT family N-acetyltransferase [Cellulomonas sp.]
MAPTIETRTAGTIAPAELYALLRLRVDVFVVEQACAYPDLDGQDLLPGTVHLWAQQDGALLGGVRVLRAGSARPTIGRVVTAPAARGHGVAGLLLREAIALCRSAAPHGSETTIDLHAQAHLERWYARAGFVRVGAQYLEDDIPHVPMALVGLRGPVPDPEVAG